MTDEQIIQEVGFEQASDQIKQSAVDAIRATVDIRVGALIGELLTDEQADRLEELHQLEDKSQYWDFLRTEVAQTDMREVYEATLQSYLEEVKKQQAAF